MAHRKYKPGKGAHGLRVLSDEEVAKRLAKLEAAPATEPTAAGLQYVMPGCEKDQTRGPVQMSLF